MMCKVCGEVFEATELRGEYDAYPYGEEMVLCQTNESCPVCGASELTTECGCVQCGETVNAEEVFHGFCRYCKEELEQTLDWICGMLTPAQMRWIAEHPEWIERGEALC